MWRSVAIAVVLAGMLAGCSWHGSQAASSHGGFKGADAHWYDVAYKRCAADFKQAKNQSGHALDFMMETPKEAGHQKAATAGCAAAAKDAGAAYGNLYETTP
jgi:hypothetical protein